MVKRKRRKVESEKSLLRQIKERSKASMERVTQIKAAIEKGISASGRIRENIHGGFQRIIGRGSESFTTERLVSTARKSEWS